MKCSYCSHCDYTTMQAGVTDRFNMYVQWHNLYTNMKPTVWPYWYLHYSYAVDVVYVLTKLTTSALTPTALCWLLDALCRHPPVWRLCCPRCCCRPHWAPGDPCVCLASQQAPAQQHPPDQCASGTGAADSGSLGDCPTGYWPPSPAGCYHTTCLGRGK